MTYNSRSTVAICFGLVFAACEGGFDPEVLAVAAGHELSIDQAVDLLASQTQLPNRPEVVEAVADLWIDYTLLAQAALEDSLLESIDLTPLVRRQMEQEMVYRLRDAAIQVDTVVTNEELERLWVESGPDGQVSARHILLSVPDDAADAARDSVRSLAATLKARAEAGEDFGALAREYSSDRGSAEEGGNLGTFGRNEMLAPFAEAAFSLEPGQISDPVETIYGFHIILVDAAEIESLEDDEVRANFLGQVRGARAEAAESLYVASIEDPAEVEVLSDVFQAMREIAQRPGQRLSRRGAKRPLAKYDGGAVTMGDFQEFVQGQAPAFRSQVGEADSVALRGLALSLVRGELLVNAAAAAGHSLDPAEMDSLRAGAQNQMLIAATQLGLEAISPTEGQSPAEAVEERVMSNLTDILQGRRDVIPLGVISYTLRQRYRGEVFQTALEETVSRLQVTGQRPAPRPATRAPNAPRPAEPDSSGSGGS